MMDRSFGSCSSFLFFLHVSSGVGVGRKRGYMVLARFHLVSKKRGNYARKVGIQTQGLISFVPSSFDSLLVENGRVCYASLRSIEGESPNKSQNTVASLLSQSAHI